jgi:hypothetical protein
MLGQKKGGKRKNLQANLPEGFSKELPEKIPKSRQSQRSLCSTKAHPRHGVKM